MNLEHWRKQLLLSEEENEANDRLAEVRLMIEARVESSPGQRLNPYNLARELETSHESCREILAKLKTIKVIKGKKGNIYESRAPSLLPTLQGLIAQGELDSLRGGLGEQAIKDHFEMRKRGKKRLRAVERY